jgi:hypothetical protein
VGIGHTVDDTVGGCGSFCLEAEVEHIREIKQICQYVHVGIGSRREISAANQPAKTNGPPVLHDKAAHFAGILNAFKGDDTLSGLDGSNGVVGTLFRAGDE